MKYPNEVMSILRETAKFYDQNPHAWTTGNLVQDHPYEEVKQYCLLGALGEIGAENPYYFSHTEKMDLAYDESCVHVPALDEAEKVFKDYLLSTERMENDWQTLVRWNDMYVDNGEHVAVVLRECANAIQERMDR